MKFVIMGSGGIGGYYGGRLAAAGVDTHFVARGAHLEAMRDHGLEVKSPLGDLTLASVQVTDDPSSITGADCIVFATKLWDVRDAGAACQAALAPDGVALSLQNGVSAEEELANILGPDHVLGGVAEITSFIDRPGIIAHRGDFARIRFGELDGRRSERAERIFDTLSRAGIETELSEDINRLLWLKFVLIVGSSNLTALTRQTFGPIRDNPQTLALISKSFEEVIAVGRAKNVALDDDTLAERMAFFGKLPAGMTTSLANDLNAGSRLEIDWLAGEVSRLGKALNVPTPFNDLVYSLIKPNAEGRGSS